MTKPGGHFSIYPISATPFGLYNSPKGVTCLDTLGEARREKPEGRKLFNHG